MKKILLALAIGLTAVGNLEAAKYWDLATSGATPGAGGATPTGTWDTTTANWTTDSTGSIATTIWTAADDAIFSAGSDATGTFSITVSGTQTANSVTVEEGTITMLTGVLTFGATNGVFDIADGAMFNNGGAGTGTIGGTAGITVQSTGGSGTGVLRLGGGNAGATGIQVTGSGPMITINSGIAEFSADLGLGVAPTGSPKADAVLINNGGTLRYGRTTNPQTAPPNATNAVGEIVVNRGITLSGTATIDVKFDAPATVGSSPLLIDSKISGGVGTTLVKTGAGEVRMNPGGGVTQHDFAKLQILGGLYRIGQAITLGTDGELGAVPVGPLADAVTIDNNAALSFNGAGGAGGDTITLSANRGFTIGSGGGTLQVDLANAVIPGTLTGSGTLTKTGTLALTLSGDSTASFSGSTNINAGTVRLTNTTGSALGTGPVSINSASTLSLESTSAGQTPGGITIASGGTMTGNGSYPSTSPLTINSGGIVKPGLGAANATLTLPNVDFEAGSPGSILQTTLGAANTSDVLAVTTPDTGLTLNGGTVTLAPLAAAGNISGQTFTLISYPVPTSGPGYVGSVANMKINDLSGFEGTTIFDDTVNHLIKVTIGTGSTDRTWVQYSGGNPDFFQWSLNGASAANGGDGDNWAKDLGGGTWATPVAGPNGIGSTARFVDTVPAGLPNAGSVIPSETITISDLSKTVGHLLIGNTQALTITSSTTSYKLNMQVSSGSADITVTAGSHTISTGATTAGGGITFTSPTNVTIASGSSLTVNPVANTGGMTLSGGGTLIITSNDWTGVGNIDITGTGTTLQYQNNATGLNNSGIVTIGAGAIMDMNTVTAAGVGDTIGALAGSGTLDHHANLTINGNNTTPQTFSGTIDTSGANTVATTRTFTKNGTGTQIFSGTVTSTNASFITGTVSAGTLLLNNTSLANSLMTGTTTVTNATIGGNGFLNGPLTINSGANSTLTPGSSGLGSIGIFHLGTGTLTLSASGTVPAAMAIELNTTIANGDINDQVDASSATVTVSNGTLALKPKFNIINAGTMTGGTYDILKYGTLTTANFNLLTLGTQPTGFLYKLFNDTGSKTVQLLVEFTGDFNNDNVVDASDYVIWRKNSGIGSGALFTQGDANNDGAVNNTDYDIWRANFGNLITVAGAGSGLGGNTATVPEPATFVLALAGLAFAACRRRR